MTEYPYVYYWHRQDRKGQPCRVVTRGKMNSCCVEFEDGYSRHLQALGHTVRSRNNPVAL